MLDKDVLNGVSGIYTDGIDKLHEVHEVHDKTDNESNGRTVEAITSRRYT